MGGGGGGGGGLGLGGRMGEPQEIELGIDYVILL